MTVFKFEIAAKVNIIELKRPGVVVGINITTYGTTYEVRYFWDGVPYTVGFYDWELDERVH